jgi:hypothetical protein
VELLTFLAVKEWTDTGSSARLTEAIHGMSLKGLWVEELSGTVSRTGNQHSMIVSVGEGEDFTFMHVLAY